MTKLRDASTWPLWQPEIKSSDGSARLEAGDVVRGRAQMLGFYVQGRSEATSASEEMFEEDVIVGVAMRVRYEVVPEGAGCRVIHRLESELPGGLSGSILSFLLRARFKRMQRAALRNLLAQSELDSS